jgi:predicted nucleotidyltransferase
MVNRKSIDKMKQAIVNKLQAFFPAYPVEKAWIFGSYARGEETRKSDVDVLVRFDKDAHITLIDYAGIMIDLEKLLHRKVDLVEEGTLYRFAQESVEQDKLLVYERSN